MEDRIIELETKSAYQEHLLQELNDVIISQQQQIDDLKAMLKMLQKQFQTDHQNTPVTTEREVPPHY
ncbi:MAG: SlyX family protein [Mariprofundaceae bacterium]|nr:SlyX family protein [Mariprofundaceae bacterium]